MFASLLGILPKPLDYGTAKKELGRITGDANQHQVHCQGISNCFGQRQHLGHFHNKLHQKKNYRIGIAKKEGDT